jgi:hypothetical protein
VKKSILSKKGSDIIIDFFSVQNQLWAELQPAKPSTLRQMSTRQDSKVVVVGVKQGDLKNSKTTKKRTGFNSSECSLKCTVTSSVAECLVPDWGMKAAIYRRAVVPARQAIKAGGAGTATRCHCWLHPLVRD